MLLFSLFSGGNLTARVNEVASRHFPRCKDEFDEMHLLVLRHGLFTMQLTFKLCDLNNDQIVPTTQHSLNVPHHD
jgi:hypothetical protein